MFRVIIAGGRKFNDYNLLKSKMDYYLQNKNKEDIVIVSGTAYGADKLGERYAEENGYAIHRYPADWSLGKRAGYIRNAEMAKNADACVCFWDGLSRGTSNMCEISRRNNLPLKIVKY